MKRKWISLIVALVIPVGLVGGLSAWVAGSSMELYESFVKPPLSPPGWLFPVMWTILFVLMGVASWLIYRSDSPLKSPALFLYGAQLAVNFFWTLTFFGERYYSGARAFVGHDPHYHSPVWPHRQAGRLAAGALCAVGHLCRISELFHRPI